MKIKQIKEIFSVIVLVGMAYVWLVVMFLMSEGI